MATESAFQSRINIKSPQFNTSITNIVPMADINKISELADAFNSLQSTPAEEVIFTKYYNILK